MAVLAFLTRIKYKMVILGIGSNVGDRLVNLRKALIAIKNIPDLKYYKSHLFTFPMPCY